MAGVRIEGLVKSFGGRPALDVAALDIRDGEFFSLLGPSGCGKTTMLRSIAGLTNPDRGRVWIGERDVTAVPTYRRNLGMVFQKYALFPHLTVAENIAYGLRERGVPAAEMEARVTASLALVALPGFADRYPHQLSGGQQQRVAFARAAVYQPDVLLLDEPLSNLDVQLRVQMRVELKRLQQTLRVTTVFVTHDQHEALALSDRIAVMREGRIDQIGTPREVYESPASTYVAAFVGGTNLIRATVTATGGSAMTVTIEGAGTMTLPLVSGAAPGSVVTIAAKPEGIRLGDDTPAALTGRMASVAYLGASYSYLVALGSQHVEVVSPKRVGEGEVRIAIDADAARIFV